MTSEQASQAKAVLLQVDCPQPSQKAKQDFQELLAIDRARISQVGNVMAHTETFLIQKTNPSFLVQETLRVRLADLRQELGAQSANPEEKLLIEVVCLAWLRLSILEQKYSQQMEIVTSVKVGLYWEKRLDSAQKRYREAVESLARVRRLLRKNIQLQVNIASDGGQQLNALQHDG